MGPGSLFGCTFWPHGLDAVIYSISMAWIRPLEKGIASYLAV